MVNFTMTRGDNVVFSGAVTLSEDPLDISGASFWFTGKRQTVDEDVDAIFQKTVGDGITIVQAGSGLISIALVPADTNGLTNIKTYLFYDLQMKDSNDKIYTIASGKLIIEPDVTESTS